MCNCVFKLYDVHLGNASITIRGKLTTLIILEKNSYILSVLVLVHIGIYIIYNSF